LHVSRPLTDKPYNTIKQEAKLSLAEMSIDWIHPWIGLDWVR